MNITYEQILAVLIAKDLTIENQRQQIVERDSLIAQQGARIAELEKPKAPADSV